MDFEEKVWEGVCLIHVARNKYQLRAVAYKIMNLRILVKAGNFLSSCAFVNFSRTLLSGVCISLTVHWACIKVKQGFRLVLDRYQLKLNVETVCISETLSAYLHGVSTHNIVATHSWSAVCTQRNYKGTCFHRITYVRTLQGCCALDVFF